MFAWRGMTDHEKKALQEIRDYLAQPDGALAAVWRRITRPVDRAGEMVMGTPYLGDVLRGAATGIVSVVNDGAQWSVRPGSILDVYRKAGHCLRAPSDVHGLRLDEVDPAIGMLAAKYKVLALAEGGAAGAGGGFALAVDVAALIGLSLRAVGEYATYCGFDITRQEERLFALNILMLSSSQTDAAKSMALANLQRVALDVARRKAWRDLQKSAWVQVIREVAKVLGVRLTKAKLAQAVPMAGAVVGGGYNAFYVAKVTEAAWYLYRRRFLAARYGVRVLG